MPYIKAALRYDILLKTYDDFESVVPQNYDNFKGVFGSTFSLGYIPRLDIGINPAVEFSYHLDLEDTYSGTNNTIRNNAIEISLGLVF